VGYVVKRTDAGVVLCMIIEVHRRNEQIEDFSQLMTTNNVGVPLILVVEDVEETRDGIEQLLQADGYRVDPARDEEDAVVKARHAPPHLLLVSLGGPTIEVITIAVRIRDRAALSPVIPIVVFCVPTVAEGAEVEIARHVYLTRPDNFNQLRTLLRRLLQPLLPTS
jgi:two-component system response regulator PhoP